MAMWITTIKHIFPKGTEILFLAHLVVPKWAFLSNLINAILRTFANIKWWCLSCIFWGNGPGQVAGFQSNLLKSGWNLPNGSNLRLKNPRLPATVSTGYYCSLQRPLKGKEYCLFKYFIQILFPNNQCHFILNLIMESSNISANSELESNKNVRVMMTITMAIQLGLNSV